MKLVVYHASAWHPNHPVGIYDKLWPIFLDHAHRHGYEVTQLTDEKDVQRGDVVLRFPVDANVPMFSREVCWVNYLRHADPSEQHCMVEPDMLIQRKIPELGPGKDLAVLARPRESLCPGFRLCLTTALPFYERILHHFTHDVPVKMRAWHGDVAAMHLAMNWPPTGHSGIPPKRWGNLHIEKRRWFDYWERFQGAVIYHYKGSSKADMFHEPGD